MKKDDLFSKIRANQHVCFDMPDIAKMTATIFDDPLKQFCEMSKTVGGSIVILNENDDINEVIRNLHPEAKRIASNLDFITIANVNPDTIESANDLNGTDVGIIEGLFGVAENGCVWVPQTMKERAVCFISEYLVIILDRQNIVNNMHEAYKRISFNDYGYGCFISGPSKTADIAQALVMGAQAARGVTVIIR